MLLLLPLPALAPLDGLSYPSCMVEPANFRDFVSFAGTFSANRYKMDIPRFLYALSAIESSYGRFNLPRHEPAFARGGRYFQHELDRQFGDLAACSLGPWQIMFPNAHKIMKGHVKPMDFLADDGLNLTSAVASALWLDYEIGRGATTLEQIADAWNTGSHRDSIKPAPIYFQKVAEGWNRWEAD